MISKKKTRKFKHLNKKKTKTMYGGAAAAASNVASDTTKSNKNLTKLPKAPMIDEQLFQVFFKKYITNLYYDVDEFNPEKYNKYILLLINIYLSTPAKKITEITPELKTKLFMHLYKTVIDYKIKLASFNGALQDFIYINMHGTFSSNASPKIIPDNFVLVFLTPVNRYSSCRFDNIKQELAYLNSKSNRMLLQSNILCMDKQSTDNTVHNRNNRHYSNAHKFFRNALVLLPGQYYYDLYLSISFEDKDTGLGLNIYNFKDTFETYESVISSLDELKDNPYKIFLSEYLDELNKQESTNTKYIIINCCRNIDHIITNTKRDFEYGLDIYIYENFMLYFNTIMSNCEVFDSQPTPEILFNHDKATKYKQTLQGYTTALYGRWKDKLTENTTETAFEQQTWPYFFDLLDFLSYGQERNIDIITNKILFRCAHLFKEDFRLYIELLEKFIPLEQIKSRYLTEKYKGVKRDILESILDEYAKECTNIHKFILEQFFKTSLEEVEKVFPLYVLHEMFDANCDSNIRTDSFDSSQTMSILNSFKSALLYNKDLTTIQKGFENLLKIYNDTLSIINLIKQKPQIQTPPKLKPFKHRGNKRLGHIGRQRLFAETNITNPELQSFIETESQQINGSLKISSNIT